ncbi:MAG: hypothetical protein ACRDSL_06885 [Pseudonocardiaceae bacterium]
MSTWISEHVFGRALLAKFSGTVRVIAPRGAESSVLALHRERYELAKTVRTIAAKSRKAIELRVLQYGVTRERLAEAVGRPFSRTTRTPWCGCGVWTHTVRSG